MCENCLPSEEMKKAHEEFEAAINKFVEAMNRVPDENSVMVDWVLLSSRSILGEDGMTHTACGWEVGINQQLYRTKGLLLETLQMMQASDVVSMLRHG